MAEDPHTQTAEPPAAAPPDGAAAPAAPPTDAGARSARTTYALWVVAFVMLTMSALLHFSSQPGRVTAPSPPEGLTLALAEVEGPNGMWFLEGTVQNGPADVHLAQYGVTWADDQGRIVAMSSVEVRELKAGQPHNVKVAISGYTPGMKRTIVPIRFE